MRMVVISGSSHRLIKEEIKKIVEEHNYIKMNINQCGIKSVLEEASYFSFMQEEKFIVASNADFFASKKMSEAEEENMLQYLNHPNENTTLIFTLLEPVDLRKKISKIIKDNYELIVIPNFDKIKIKEEIMNYLGQYKYTCDYETAMYLIDNTYNNLDVLFNELDKIMLYYNNPCKITKDDVLKIVGKEEDSNIFHFINAVIERRIDASLQIYKSLKIYKVEPISLINLLAREYRLMYMVKNYSNQKYDLKKISSLLKLPDWQISKLYNNSLNYREDELLANLYSLGDIDLKIKKGIYDKDIALYPFLMHTCS